jgi:hypothetical protein
MAQRSLDAQMTGLGGLQTFTARAIMDEMPELARVTVGLRIFGDTLDPDEITRLLGVEPTGCARKGDTHRTASGREVIASSGSWRLHSNAPGNLSMQIGALLAKLPSDPSLWRELSQSYDCDVFCGLFMREGNEGTELKPQVLSMLGDRSLRLGFDIYTSAD